MTQRFSDWVRPPFSVDRGHIRPTVEDPLDGALGKCSISAGSHLPRLRDRRTHSPSINTATVGESEISRSSGTGKAIRRVESTSNTTFAIIDQTSRRLRSGPPGRLADTLCAKLRLKCEPRATRPASSLQ